MSDERSSGGIGVLGATFIIFLVLKLTGHIGWSWWFVTGPLWMPLAATVTLSIPLAIIYAMVNR